MTEETARERAKRMVMSVGSGSFRWTVGNLGWSLISISEYEGSESDMILELFKFWSWDL